MTFARTLPAMLAVAVVSVAAPPPAKADFVFTTPSAKQQNRVYWLDRRTGTVGACQYTNQGGPNGTMLCFPPGDQATGQVEGDYDFVVSSFETEFGIFRVDRASGRLSLCFVKPGPAAGEDKVVCTPQATAK